MPHIAHFPRPGESDPYVENIWPKPQFWRCTNSATVVQSHFQKEKMFQKPTIPGITLKGKTSKQKKTFQFGHCRCAFSYASSDHETLCRSSCIACRQKVSRRCVKACDTSYYCSDCKNSCTVYKQRAFLQCTVTQGGKLRK